MNNLIDERTRDSELAVTSDVAPINPFAIVWRSRWIVLGITITCIILATVYVMKAP